MDKVLQRVYEIGIIPVIAIDDADKAVPLARALVKGGLPAAGVTFRGGGFSGLERYQATQRYAPSGEDFLSILDQEELIREMWPEEEDVVRLFVDEVRLYDRDGADVTEQYLDNAGPLNWGGSIGTYEFFMLYVGMGIVAVLAGCAVYLLLRRS